MPYSKLPHFMLIALLSACHSKTDNGPAIEPPDNRVDLQVTLLTTDPVDKCRALDNIEIEIFNDSPSLLGVGPTIASMKVGNRPTRSISVNGITANQGASVTMPEPDTIPAGDYTVVINIDANHDVDERDETNNTIAYFCIG